MRGEKFQGLWRVARSKIALALLLIFIVLIGNAAMNMYGRYKEANARADRAAEELVLLNERKAKLSADLERLSTPRGTEEELRKRFDVAAEGERVIVIVDQKSGEADDSSPRVETMWQKIVKFFSTGR